MYIEDELEGLYDLAEDLGTDQSDEDLEKSYDSIEEIFKTEDERNAYWDKRFALNRVLHRDDYIHFYDPVYFYVREYYNVYVMITCGEDVLYNGFIQYVPENLFEYCVYGVTSYDGFCVPEVGVDDAEYDLYELLMLKVRPLVTADDE